MNAAALFLVVELMWVGMFPPRLFDRGRKDDSAPLASTAKKEEEPKPDGKSRKEERSRRSDKLKPDAPVPGAFEVEVMANIAYRDDRDADPVRHKLDLYLPKGQTNFPVVFFVHGGGWHSGNKEMYAPLGQLLARNGLGAVITNYRLSPQSKFPAQVEDVAKSFAWVHGSIARYGGRPDRIIAAGHSAGGHLVSLLCTDERYLNAEKCSLKDIRAVISMCGVYALDEIYGMYSSVFGRDRTDRRDASPLYHVNDHEPPFLLMFAEKDLPTIEKVTGQFYDELRKAKCDVRELKMAKRTHVSLILLAGNQDDPTGLAMFDFIERQTEWKRPPPPARAEGNKP